jgi:rubrerythrin
MKYPTFDMMNKLNLENEDFSQILEIIIECIDYIYDENNVYYKKDVTKEELISFIENLEQSNLEKIQKFFDTLPKIKKDIDFKCNKCGYTENIVVEGLASFFV